MTDEQVIKAWECCAEWKNIKDCDGCPVKDGCSQRLAKYSLDLIKRKDAEIEKKNTEIDILIEKKDTLQDENSELMAEVEMLKKDKYILKDGNLELLPRTDIDIIKSEAIREFAERLKEKYKCYDTNVGVIGKMALYKDIDNLVKEMVGDEK